MMHAPNRSESASLARCAAQSPSAVPQAHKATCWNTGVSPRAGTAGTEARGSSPSGCLDPATRGSCCSVSLAPPFWAASSLKGVPASPLSGSGSGPSADGLKADGCALALLSLPSRPEQGSRGRMGDHCSPPCHGTCVGNIEQCSLLLKPPAGDMLCMCCNLA